MNKSHGFSSFSLFEKGQHPLDNEWIALDLETTGLDPAAGHRVVEIGCVELINHMPTGETRQWYINPERDMPEDAFNVHGLSEEFLTDKPVFGTIAEDFLAFVEGAGLIAHNANFDIRFLNAELAALDRPNLPQDRVLDTIALDLFNRFSRV